MIELNGKGCRVRVIADSVANMMNNRSRITTLELRYWRAIHAEFMTHRVFSRNAGSSRAIPVAKIIEQVRNDPAGPIHWGANQRGMQAGAEIDSPVLVGVYDEFDNPSDEPLFRFGTAEVSPQEAWRLAALDAAANAEAFAKAGYHKQLVNRLLEPFQYINVLVTATDWHNFFELRDHADAQPEIQDLARTMKAAMDQSAPIVRSGNAGDPEAWHLPYVLDSERELIRLDVLKKISTARCARVSYEPFDGNAALEKELERYDLLVGSKPLHASPTEHQAHPMANGSDRNRNFRGWKQYREDVEVRIARESAQALARKA
ncbi:FAD-dependent thymidylate synthase [Burkholderia sp. 22088]|uniref:FAD-dependent thymidylate synthase n=1 Tax=Burkholderia sp. 22088 TaxID=3453871 RepID=UPI003F8638EB